MMTFAMQAVFSVLIFASAALLAYNFLYVSEYIKKTLEERMEKQKKEMEKAEKETLSSVRKGDIVRTQAALGLLGLLLAVGLNSFFLFFVFVVIIIISPKYYIRMKEQQYLKSYKENLPEFLETITSSIRSGMSVINAIQEYAKKNQSAVGSEMRYMLSRIELGLSAAGALSELEHRIKTEENELIVTALVTAMESGGNVSEVLSTILNSLRKKDEIEKEMKALTSQGVMSGFIVGALPFLLLIAIFFFDRELIMPMFTTKIGIAMLVAAVCMEAVGAFLISKIVKMKE